MKSTLLLLLLASLTTRAETESFTDSMVVNSSVLEEDQLSSVEGFRYISTNEQKSTKNISQFSATVAGVATKESGGVGSFETISIRGVAGSRVGVFIDGIPYNSAMGGAVDLSRFSMSDFEGIEIYKGITPARFGGNSLGGVINLISKSGVLAESKEFSLMVGSYNEFRGSARFSQPVKSSHFYGSILYHAGDNNYPYLDRNGTPYNPDDDMMITLSNNRSVDFNSQIGLRKKIKPGKLALSWTHREKSLELPASEGFVNQTAETREREDRVLSSLSQEIGNGDLIHSLTFVQNQNRVFWTGLDNFGSVHGVLKGDQWGELKSQTYFGEARTNYTLTPLPRLTISGSLFGSFEQMLPSTDVVSFGYGEWESSRLTGANATDFTLSGDALFFVAGGSITGHHSETKGGEDPYTGYVLDSQSVNDVDYSGRIGVNTYLADGIVSIFSNGAIYTRTPSLRELYGYHGGVLPSPDLKREQGGTVELGSSWELDKSSGEITFFYNHFDNLITTLFDGRVARSVNLGETRSFGIEQTLFWNPVSFVSIRESMTLQNTENLSSLYKGNLLPNQAPFTLFTDFTVGPFAGASLSTTLKYESLLFRDEANLLAFPGNEGAIGHLNLSFFGEWSKEWFTVTGGVRNVLEGREHDDSRFTIESGYYKTLYPGRVWQFEMKFNF
jgi:outer membrane receptor protein involved in Fe transport